MKQYRLTLNFPSGGVLVGGQAETPDGMHGAHARDARGLPMIPSTALRGALRETYERLLRGAGQRACAGGNGHDPVESEAARAATETGVLPDIPCTLDNGGRCKACRLFGSRRTHIDPGERMFSALRVGDARMEDLEPETSSFAQASSAQASSVQATSVQASSVQPSSAPATSVQASSLQPWSIRPGVAISRKTRSAEDRRLFLRQVPNTPDLELAADLWLLDPELEHDLKVVVETTRHLGSGRSRGLGRVDLRLDEVPVAAAPEIRLDDPTEVRLRLTLEAPASFSTPVMNRSLADTRTEIPGAALRGMVGFTLARLVEDAKDPAFQELVDKDEGAHFGFLYHAGRDGAAVGLNLEGDERKTGAGRAVPGTGSASSDAGKRQLEVSAPLPITAETCKLEQRQHGVKDTLFERIAVTLVESPEQAEALAGRSQSICLVSDCGGRMRAAEGVRRNVGRLPIRAVTRVSIERSRQSALDEALFSRRLIEAGTVFEGTIRNIPPGSVARLEQALSQPPAIGRGHSHGWGRCRIEVLPPLEVEPMESRISRFQHDFRKFLEDIPLDASRVPRLIPLTLLSPLAEHDEEKGLEPVRQALGGAKVSLKLRRFEREGSWDQQHGLMRAFQAVSAGGVYVIELPEGQEAGQWAERLVELERAGIGEYRHQGFGRIRFFDPFHLERQMTPQPEKPDMDTETYLRASRGRLVEAAERVVKGLVGQGRNSLNKSQLNHLVNVCGDAASVAEIRNYLRYQAGRDNTGWTPERANQVIEAPAAELAKIEERNATLGAEERQRLQVEAWKLYAIYLTRAYTYEAKADREQNQGQRGPGSGRG